MLRMGTAEGGGASPDELVECLLEGRQAFRRALQHALVQLAIVGVQIVHVHEQTQRPAILVLLKHLINLCQVGPPAMVEVEELAEVSFELQALL